MKFFSNKIVMSVWLMLITLGIFTLGLGTVDAGDPNGSATYSDSIGGLKYSINFTWTLHYRWHIGCNCFFPFWLCLDVWWF